MQKSFYTSNWRPVNIITKLFLILLHVSETKNDLHDIVNLKFYQNKYALYMNGWLFFLFFF